MSEQGGEEGMYLPSMTWEVGHQERSKSSEQDRYGNPRLPACYSGNRGSGAIDLSEVLDWCTAGQMAWHGQTKTSTPTPEARWLSPGILKPIQRHQRSDDLARAY